MPLDNFAILHLAREAVAHTRQRLWNRSENKGYNVKVRSERAQNYSEVQVAARTTQYNRLLSLKPRARQLSHKEILIYEKQIVNFGVGGNYEYSVVAYTYLYSRLIDFNIFLDIVGLSRDFFVVLNQPTSGLTHVRNNPGKLRYHKDFSNWSPGAVFCNAWANIVCNPLHYILQWQAKMTKWSNRGMLINRTNPDTSLWYSEPTLVKNSAIDRSRP